MPSHRAEGKLCGEIEEADDHPPELVREVRVL